MPDLHEVSAGLGAGGTIWAAQLGPATMMLDMVAQPARDIGLGQPDVL